MKNKTNFHLKHIPMDNHREKRIAFATLAGISLFSFSLLTGGLENKVHADSVSTNQMQVSTSGSASTTSSDTSSSASISSTASTTSETSNASSNSTSASNSSSSSSNSSSAVVSGTSNQNSAATKTTSSASASSSSQSNSQATNSNSSNNSSSVSSIADGLSFRELGADDPTSEPTFQRVVTLMGTDNLTHPYVVSGNNNAIVKLPNGDTVKISNNQLVDPTTNQPLNNNDTFTDHPFTPQYQSFPVTYQLKFVDQYGNPIANQYNNYAADGITTKTVNIQGYYGEPFNLFYRDQFGNQYSGYEAQTINNQIDSQNGKYMTAILGQGMLNGNQTVQMVTIPDQVNLKYYTLDASGAKQYFDGGTTTIAPGQHTVDATTPFQTVKMRDGQNLNQYFDLPQAEILKETTTIKDPQPNQTYSLEIPLNPKPVTQQLKVLVKSTDGSETYNATITFNGNYGRPSSENAYISSINFDGYNPLNDNNNPIRFLSNNTVLWASLGTDGHGNYNNQDYVWTQDNQKNLSWTNTSNSVMPVLYFEKLNKADVVEVPQLNYNFRFWGPDSISGSSYNPSGSYNILHDPYNLSNYAYNGLPNGVGAVNYRTFHNWIVTSDQYAPVNTIYDLTPFAYNGFTTDDYQTGSNDYVIQITRNGPSRLAVSDNSWGRQLTDTNGNGIAFQNYPEQISGATAGTKDGVSGYYIPRSAFKYNGAGKDDQVFYPAGVMVMNEWNSGDPLVYNNGNYYYATDTQFQNPIQFKTTASQPTLNGEQGGHKSYFIGDVNNYAQPQNITLKYLNVNNTDGTTVGSPNQLPNAYPITQDKVITAYTEDRIYYDTQQNSYVLSRYGKITDRGQTASDITEQSTNVFPAPKGWIYVPDTQEDYAYNNFGHDASKRGGEKVASWIVGLDTDSPTVNTQMHPYAPDNTDNTVAVYLKPDPNSPYMININIPYINLTNGKQIYYQSKQGLYDPQNPSTLDISQYIPVRNSQYGTLMLQNGHSFNGYNDYLYFVKDQLTLPYNGNQFITDYIYLLPYDPNDPANKNKDYPLTIHYVDENGQPIDQSTHNFNVTGTELQTVKQAMQNGGKDFWDYTTENWQKVGVKVQSMVFNYTNDEDAIFNQDSKSNNHMIFGKYTDIFIVLKKNDKSNSGGSGSNANNNGGGSGTNGGSGSGNGGGSAAGPNSSNSANHSNNPSSGGNGSNTNNSGGSNNSNSSATPSNGGSNSSNSSSNSSNSGSNGSSSSTNTSNGGSNTSNSSNTTSNGGSNTSNSSATASANSSSNSGASSSSSNGSSNSASSSASSTASGNNSTNGSATNSETSSNSSSASSSTNNSSATNSNSSNSNAESSANSKNNKGHGASNSANNSGSSNNSTANSGNNQSNSGTSSTNSSNSSTQTTQNNQTANGTNLSGQSTKWSASKLPQTGEDTDAERADLLGLIMLALSGLTFGRFGFRKKRQK